MSARVQVGIHFGALCDPIKAQLRVQGLVAPNVKVAQDNANAITRLHIHGLITDSEAQKARKRLLKSITRNARWIKGRRRAA